MKININFEDKYVVLDGEPHFAGDRLVSPNKNYKSMHWDQNKGWAEVYRGERVWFTDNTDFLPFINLHNELSAKRKAEIAEVLSRPDTPVPPQP